MAITDEHWTGNPPQWEWNDTTDNIWGTFKTSLKNLIDKLIPAVNELAYVKVFEETVEFDSTNKRWKPTHSLDGVDRLFVIYEGGTVTGITTNDCAIADENYGYEKDHKLVSPTMSGNTATFPSFHADYDLTKARQTDTGAHGYYVEQGMNLINSGRGNTSGIGTMHFIGVKFNV